MTLHADVAELLAAAGIPRVGFDDAVADEHVRWSAYRRIVSVIASSSGRERDRAIVATILRDPVEMVAKSAVVALVDEIAMRKAGPAEFREWASGLLPEIDGLEGEGHREFIRRRIRDWLFHLHVQDGHVPTTAELAEVTDWMQRTLAEGSRSPAVLALLAESGRRKKTRNVAENRARSRELRAR
ncbi:hypothetical protein ACH43Y_19940 [Streptomyces rubiginosohelvolus]|uniref:hypothetical protein n=1 Tax=Streptomyces rubiginosohelvolus TaxID=67362 RepID=UPI00379DA7B6